MSTDDVKATLRRFKGVGPKTVSCVLMFTLGRAEFPVDTHVWRIAKRLGWVPANAGT
jgi:endonuclease-3